MFTQGLHQPWNGQPPSNHFLEEAGKVLNVDTMEPLTYNKESLVNLALWFIHRHCWLIKTEL